MQTRFVRGQKMQKRAIEMQRDDRILSRCASAACRSCHWQGLREILDLGRMPASDRFLSEEELTQQEPTYPLELAFCPNCALVQIVETVVPTRLFGPDYVYRSSFSDALLAHARQNALELIQSRGLGPDSFVVELASNDG